MDSSSPSTDALRRWLTTELDRLSLDPSADAHLGTEDYLVGVLTEDLISNEDKIDGMADFMNMTFADQPAMSPDLAVQFVHTAMAKYAELTSLPQGQLEGDADADHYGQDENGNGSGADSAASSDEEQGEENPSSPSVTTSSSGKRVMTKEEVKRRKAILQQYGYEGTESDSEIDPVKAVAMAGQLALPKKKSRRAQVSYDVLLAMPNDNKKKQQDAELAKRAALKAQHDAKVARDKAALAKQKAVQAAKEAAKKTVKQEKRRM